MKKLLMAAAAAAALSCGLCFSSAGAADTGAAYDKMPLPPQMRPPRPDKKQVLARLHREYGFAEADLEKYAADGMGLRALEKACYYAAISGKSLKQVMEMHKSASWGRVQYLLGITPETAAEAERRKHLQRMAAGGMDESSLRNAEKLLQLGYSAADVRMALGIEEKTGLPFQQALDAKTAFNSWEQACAVLDADGEAVRLLLEKEKPRRPHLRIGPGFAGLHIKGFTREKALNILHRDYKFPVSDIEEYYDKMDFDNLEILCLYAYLSQRPLEEVYNLAEKCPWERCRIILGLDARTYYDRCITYQAQRAQERLGVPRQLTEEFMRQGFAMHHVVMACLFARKSGRQFDEVILMKKPGSSWDDVARQIGLTAEESRAIKDLDTLAFGR